MGAVAHPAPGSYAYDCSCFLTFVGYSQASFILVTLLQVFLVNFAASCCNVSMTLFRILYVTFTASCCTVSTIQSFLDPSYNFRGFVQDFSSGLSCTCHGFVLHCQHSSSLKLLDNPPSFVSYLLIACRVVRLLECYTRSLSS